MTDALADQGYWAKVSPNEQCRVALWFLSRSPPCTLTLHYAAAGCTLCLGKVIKEHQTGEAWLFSTDGIVSVLYVCVFVCVICMGICMPLCLCVEVVNILNAEFVCR